jgi:hypothetical protein
MKTVTFIRAAAVLASLVCGSTVRSAFIIDHFTNATAAGTAGFSIGSGTQSVYENPGPSANGPLGGWRVFTGTYGAPGGGFLQMQVAPFFAGGALLMTNAGITATETIEYGRSAVAGYFQLNADLTGGAGYSNLLLDWLNTNSSATAESITVSSGVGTAGFATSTLNTMTLANPGVQVIPFSNWAGIDWTDVDYIGLTINANRNENYQLGQISTVPEPSSLALLGLCAAAAGGMSRRRRS